MSLTTITAPRPSIAVLVAMAMAMAMATVLTARGGGGDALADAPLTPVRVTTEPAGSNCLLGGTRVVAGFASNGSGVLDQDEVESTQFVCNASFGATGVTGAAGTTGATGAAGGNGLATPVLMISEPSGANCSNGGKKISAGLDANGNGVLDAGRSRRAATSATASMGSPARTVAMARAERPARTARTATTEATAATA